MKLNIKRNVSKFSSKGKDYGKIVIVSEELAPYTGKEIDMKIDITETPKTKVSIDTDAGVEVIEKVK